MTGIKKTQIPQAVRQILLFGLVGVFGFAVDTAVLYLLKSALGLYAARALSFVAAVFATWLLNRNITFKEKRYAHYYQEFAYYFVCMIGGGLINLGVYSLLVSFSDTAAHYPIIGVAAGSIGGMAANYLSSKFLVFRKK